MALTSGSVQESDGAYDIDTHEMVPVHLWPEIFGGDAERLAPIFAGMEHFGRWAENSIIRDDIEGDCVEVNDETVWHVKGPEAPSAIDLTRRAAVMDRMGIVRQFVFPTFGACGFLLRNNSSIHEIFGFDPQSIDRRQLGREVMDAHNAWASRITRAYGERVVPVGVLLTESVDQMMTDAEQLLSDGVRAFMISAGLPPAGLSPADEKLDPFWRMLADAKVPVMHHVASEQGFFASNVWGDVPRFAGAWNSTAEFTIEPWRSSTLHMATENFIITMTLGGVFERHPDLMLGVAELCAHWVGPLAARIDRIAELFASRFADLSLRPSEYMARQVRVSPFLWETVEQYLELYPVTGSILCYASDFPHREGGKESKLAFAERLSPYGKQVVRNFFVDNASALLPDREW